MNNKDLRELKEQLCDQLNTVELQIEGVDTRIEIEPKHLVLAGIHDVDDIVDFEVILTNIRLEFRRKED